MDPSADTSVVEVLGCCGTREDSSLYKPQVIGRMPQMTEEQAMAVLQDAKQAWNGGSGVWPQMSLGERIDAIKKFIMELKSSRDAIINVLMWEIGKNTPDATAEFDRTVQFIETMITEIQNDPEFNSDWETIGATRAFVRRTAIGIIMCLGPYNYPLNETWAMAFAALLAGNILILKIPTVGGLCHFLTSECGDCDVEFINAVLLEITANSFTQWMPLPRPCLQVLSISSPELVEPPCLH